jgi:2-dehydro-3-deoxygluconokinase
MMDFDVAAIGETMLRLTTAPGERLEDARSLAVHVAGSESNILSHIAQLGGRTAWISALPDNPPGRRVAAELRRYGVGLAVRWTDASERVGTFYAEVTPEPLGPDVTYDRSNSAFATMRPERFDLTLLARSRALLLTGITPALSDDARTLVNAALAEAERGDVPVAFDINYRARLWSPEVAAPVLAALARRAAVVFCPAGDAAALWKIDGLPGRLLPLLAERLGLRSDARLIVTLGAEGAAELSQGQVTVSAAYPSAGPHRFGSGDAFAGGYLASWLGVGNVRDQLPDLSPLQLGCAVAALKRCTPGDMAPLAFSDIARVLKTTRFR